MGDHIVHNDGTDFQPGKLRLGLSIVAIGLAMTALTLSIVYFAFPMHSTTRQAVVRQVEHATGAIGSALAAVPVFPKLEERLNVLVMGVDWNGTEAERYQGTRSDTMMLVTLDPDLKRVGIISIPRDSHVEIGRGVNKINQAHAIGGPELAVTTVRNNFNISVDNYVVVDTMGLRDIFKLLGPVEVVVEKEMDYEDKTSGLSIHLKPGKQLLTPEQAEGYVRFRKDAMADIGRMERQQWFLRQSLNKLKDPGILLKAPQLLEAGYKCVKTDLPMDKIAAILAFSKDLPPGSVMTSTLPGQGETIDGVNYFILSQKGAQAVFEGFGIAQFSQRARRQRQQFEQISSDEEVIRKKTRISIRYRDERQSEADEMTEHLKDRGWRVRQLLTRMDHDCLHAQIDLHSRRATPAVIDMIKTDLPQVSEWPVVVKYGCGGGCDLTVVLPTPPPTDTIGLSGTTAPAPPESTVSSTIEPSVSIRHRSRRSTRSGYRERSSRRHQKAMILQSKLNELPPSPPQLDTVGAPGTTAAAPPEETVSTIEIQ